MRREDSEGISGGRFVTPNPLPPTRTYRLQGGRFIPNPNLPPVRNARIEIDYEHAYHFGADPEYMKGDSEYSEYDTSTDNVGGTMYHQTGPIGIPGGQGGQGGQGPGQGEGPGRGGGGERERTQGMYCRCPLGDYTTIIEEGQTCNQVRCPNDGRPLVPAGISVDYPLPSGGQFVHPEFLPPVRTAQIQLGPPHERRGYYHEPGETRRRGEE